MAPTTPATLFRVTDKVTGEKIKVEKIDLAKHNHVTGAEFTKETIDSIIADYGKDSFVAEAKEKPAKD